MMDTIYVGKSVRISDNAFPGSDEPNDIRLRGAVGEIKEIWVDGSVSVATCGVYAYLTEDELEEVD